MTDHQIKELTEEREFNDAYSLIEQLYPDRRDGYSDILPRAREQGYRQFALFVDGEMVAVAGIKCGISFSSGEYVYVDDLVTDREHRSKGYGSELLEYVHRWARERDRDTVRLVASMSRPDAHRFYEEKMDYERRGYYFKKDVGTGASDE